MRACTLKIRGGAKLIPMAIKQEKAHSSNGNGQARSELHKTKL